MGATHSPFQFDFSQLFQHTGHTTAQSATHTPLDMAQVRAIFERMVGTHGYQGNLNSGATHSVDLANIFRSFSQQFGTQSRNH